MQEVLQNFGKNNILNEYKSIEALVMTLLKLLSDQLKSKSIEFQTTHNNYRSVQSTAEQKQKTTTAYSGRKNNKRTPEQQRILIQLVRYRAI
jgi:hypothetical protein